jgi:hypothetical protein
MNHHDDNTILLADGQSISLRLPNPAAMRIEAVAHSLALINRFTGHAVRPYSVAEHSLLVSQIIEMRGGGTLEQLAGLMHDAHEIIVGDCSSPLKREMRRIASARSFESAHLPAARTWSDFDRAEAAAEAAVRLAFGLVKVGKLFEAEVGAADLVALSTERRDLMPAHPEVWGCLHGIAPVPRNVVDLMDRDRTKWSWNDWRDAFIERYRELDFARTTHAAGQSLKVQFGGGHAA